MCHQAPASRDIPLDKYPPLMPIPRFVVEVTGEAEHGDEIGIKKAVRRYHNRLANGSIPRSIIRKIGKELFIHLDSFNDLLNARKLQKDTDR